ncbi:MAG: hypothetical protein Q4E94_07070 [Clostridia bacterium]|nr:hypothetical protein [Clostridia bacterium]
MIGKLNNLLRNIILFIGGTVVVFKIIDGAREKTEKEANTILAKEFDDIW